MSPLHQAVVPAVQLKFRLQVKVWATNSICSTRAAAYLAIGWRHVALTSNRQSMRWARIRIRCERRQLSMGQWLARRHCREIFPIDDGRRVAILVTRRSETFFVQPATCCYTNSVFWFLMKNLISMYNVDVISMRPLCGWSLSRHTR